MTALKLAKNICIVGSGNWGSVIAKIVGNNVKTNPKFADHVPMYVYEEEVNGRKLTEIINTDHENVKYLPGHKLPENVVAVPDIVEASKDADILVFVVPHQFIKHLVAAMKGNLKPNAIGVSLIKRMEMEPYKAKRRRMAAFPKTGIGDTTNHCASSQVKAGLDINEKGLQLISNVIRNALDIPCAVLMGANIAPEVAMENYCEATVGCKTQAIGLELKELFQTSYFRVSCVADEETVELCGALKNIVAVGAGLIDGLGYGDNTKAAVIRLGLMEMVKFVDTFFTKTSKIDTFLESCGVADLVTTCYSGRNRRVAEAFAKTGKTIKELEKEMLNGQQLQGPPTAAEVNVMLKKQDKEADFPLFTAIHKICEGQMPCTEFIDCLKNHPEHLH